MCQHVDKSSINMPVLFSAVCASACHLILGSLRHSFLSHWLVLQFLCSLSKTVFFNDSIHADNRIMNGVIWLSHFLSLFLCSWAAQCTSHASVLSTDAIWAYFPTVPHSVTSPCAQHAAYLMWRLALLEKTVSHYLSFFRYDWSSLNLNSLYNYDK